MNGTRETMNSTMSETKSGCLVLTPDADCNHQIRLMACAYTKISEPFVVFYSESAWIWKKPCAFLRLKSCQITENSDVSFTLTPQGERMGNSTGTLCFSAENSKEKQEWVKVLNDCQRGNEKTVTKMNNNRRINNRKLPAIQESFSEEISSVEQKRTSLIQV